MEYRFRLSGHCQLSTADQPRATRKEALRYDEETGKEYKVYDGHIDPERTSWNKILIQRSVYEVYKKMLSKAVDEYNAKQIANNHPERCKTVESYMQQIEEGEKKGNANSRPQLWNSCVVQCGNMLDNEAWTVINGKKVQPMLAVLSNEIYEDFLHRFEERYKNILVPTLAVIHNDEACCHLQMHWVSFCSTKNKKSLSVQVKLCDALAEALDKLGVKYGRKQYDNVKQAFNNDMDSLLAETMRDHGIEWIPPQKTDRLLTDEEKRKKKQKRKNINELRRDTRLIHEYLEAGIKTGDITLDKIGSINVPFKGMFYSEKAVRGYVRELCKRNEMLEAYHENTKELERRYDTVLNEKLKRTDVELQRRKEETEMSMAKREKEIRRKEIDVDRALRDVLILKEKLQDQDQQHRYEVLADELASKKVDIDHAYSMRADLYIEANRKAEAIISQARAKSVSIINEANAVKPAEKEKLRLLAERYPGIDKELDKAVTVKDAGRKKMPLRSLRNHEMDKRKRT